MKKLATVLVLSLLVLPAAWSQAPAAGAHKYFGDLKLVDQHGKERNLYTDLMKDKIVVIDVMFTACTGACPVMSTTFSKIQEHLDGILLVVRARTAPRDAILSTLQHLQEDKLLGVLFNAESESASRLKHYRYSHYSKSYGGKKGRKRT